jgi:adenylate cyclase
LRWLPNIRYGTEAYPEKVARRLRGFNIAVWVVALVPAGMALVRFIDAGPGKWKVGAADVLVAISYASMPLLHRFGPLAAPLAFVAVSYTVIFWVSSLVGTNGAERIGYFTATALAILIVGTEHYVVTAVLGVVSVGLIIIVELILPRDTGFVSPTMVFFTNFAVSIATNSALLYGIIFYAVRQMERAEATAEREYQRSEGLLINILPPRIADQLKERPGHIIADAYQEASVLFADMAGFTSRAADTSPEELVRFLNDVFTRLDALVERHGLEKIKTSGDAYMLLSGVPVARPDHCTALADLALEMREAVAGLVDPKGRAVPVRIGIASGPVVAGVVGTRKFFYDVWGDAVNMAARMESTGVPGQIQVSQEVCESLKDGFELESRGLVDIKGKGKMPTWFLNARKTSVVPERSRAAI